MSAVKTFICWNLSVRTVLQLGCTCQGCRMQGEQKAGKEHARCRKENACEGKKNKCLPSCHALFSSFSFSWLGWQTCASKRSLIFVLVIPVIRGSNLWFILHGCLQLLRQGGRGRLREPSAGTDRAQWMRQRTERGSCRSLRAAADRRRRDNWQPACSSTKNNV